MAAYVRSQPGGYRRRVKKFQNNFAEALTRRNTPFQTLEEYEDFVTRTPGYDDRIGSGAREIAMRRLKSIDPALYNRLLGAQSAEEATSVSRNNFASDQG